jgi:hypothetical protein
MAAERVCREAAQKSFDESARSVNCDWGTELDGKQIQRWAEALGRPVVQARDAEAKAFKRGVVPAGPGNGPVLLVVGVDGGRVQFRQKNAQTDSRWRENKVCTVSSYLPGDGQEKPPQKLVTTHVATMLEAGPFGVLARVEAERRGLRQAQQVLVIADCGNWIDPLWLKQFPCHERLADYHHAAEHLWEAARAILGVDSPGVPGLEAKLETWLWRGKLKPLLAYLQAEADKLGPPQQSDGEHHPRRIVHRAAGYFQRNQDHMNYPAYRARGWPIGSGNTEAGVKQFNKRVKGTEQFWSEEGVEAVMALRGLWQSQDRRWDRYWNAHPAYAHAA